MAGGRGEAGVSGEGWEKWQGGAVGGAVYGRPCRS